MPDFGRWTSNGGDPSLNEISRTDRFLDSLASEQPVYSTDPAEAELAHLLAGWRDEVRDAPLTAALTPRDAVLALDRATMSRRRTRTTLAVLGSLAAAVLCLGGFGAVIAGAGPGDALYGLRTMLFGEQRTTRDDAVVLAAQTQLAQVQQLIEQGQWAAAQDKLQTLTTTVAMVDDTERKEELVTEWQELTVKVEAQDPQATVPPGAPLPQLPVIVAPGSDAEVTSSATTAPGEETTSPSAPLTSVPSTPPTSVSSPQPSTSMSSPLPTPQPSTSVSTPQPSTSVSSPLPTPSTPLPTRSTSVSTPVPTTSVAPPPQPTATSTVAAPTRALSPTPSVRPSEVAQGEQSNEPPQTVITTTVMPELGG